MKPSNGMQHAFNLGKYIINERGTRQTSENARKLQAGLSRETDQEAWYEENADTRSVQMWHQVIMRSLDNETGSMQL